MRRTRAAPSDGGNPQKRAGWTENDEIYTTTKGRLETQRPRGVNRGAYSSITSTYGMVTAPAAISSDCPNGLSSSTTRMRGSDPSEEPGITARTVCANGQPHVQAKCTANTASSTILPYNLLNLLSHAIKMRRTMAGKWGIAEVARVSSGDWREKIPAR